ncbi:MAG: hypothetical protein A2840_02000 [Candidatus Buchananbacteria bacterium RIFCSPHIGHO2_01_FULL_47_11b]|uniref:Fido domain-containing protein n=1 Tax=Candidatus Buchananbacteria bacterium RIFCSPHIGHO2_01_FULL_47_11b TaxID=1797537 RepID=A0A1G1Y7G9_9BACT|nr:MAG: hypothetical protein A2840_02000 [Candidatus Buchananbacteria bacterium RIFCSPHIGHO2_01_FULL_47_11b]
MKTVTLREVEFIAFTLARGLMANREPIPDFQTRFPHKLESCLAVPFQKFQGKNFYHGLVAQAAILFYLLIKNHPFENGNKRIAVVTLFVFLYKNNKWLEVDNQELYNFSVWVAQSPPSLKNEVVKGVEKFIKDRLVPLK